MKDLARRFPLYSRLLKLYPLAYQKRYNEQMLQTLADMLDGTASPLHRAAIWLRTTADFPISLGQQQLHYASTAFAHEMPRFVKRNAAISALLFIPFFIIVAANDVTAHGLYHTWLWSLRVLFTWIVILPAAGFLLSATTLLWWAAQRRRTQQRTWLQSLGDIRHNWPMSIAMCIGLAILALVFFHDSTHCVAGNPLREIRNWHATWTCVQQG